MQWLAICAGLTLALAYWPAAGGAPSGARSALKTGSVAALALAAALAGGPAWLVIGLALGAIGDFCLSRPGEAWFGAGLGAFLLGHLACLALLLGDPSAAPARLAAPFAICGLAVLLALGAALLVRLWPAAGALRGPVAGYVAVILAMGAASLTLPPAHIGQWAAALFIASDALLAIEVFLLGPVDRRRRLTAPAVWGLYWLAQALFCLGFAFHWPA